jgi:hypothetical protein
LSRRKVVMEVTIETNQVLVIQRRQVTRRWCSESGSESDFAGLDEANALFDKTRIQQGIEASSSHHLPDIEIGSGTISRQPLLGATAVGATTLAKRFLNCFGRGSRRESEPRGLKGQKSKSVDKA